MCLFSLYDDITMTRKIPNKKYLEDFLNNHADIIRSIYEGLSDFPSLKKAYPYLNLDELLMFAATLRKKRMKEQNYGLLLQTDFINTMKSIYNNGYAWFKTKLNFEQQRVNHYQEFYALNPYSSKTLAQRISALKSQNIDKEIVDDFLKPESIYIFEGNYNYIKHLYQGLYDIRIMNFQPKYPDDYTKINQRYIKEIHNILSDYPQEIISEFLDMFRVLKQNNLFYRT